MTQHDVEQVIGRLLQVGVLLAAAVVLTGGIMFLAQHGAATPDTHAFRGEPPGLSTLGGILHGVAALDAGAIVQLGLVLLIATPVARVALTLVVFAIQRDRMFVLLTLLVLVLLVFGLVSGRG